MTPARAITDPVMEAAEQLAAARLSVVAVRPDGSKRPKGKWKGWQRARPTSRFIRQHFRGGGLAVMGGRVSGNLEVLDVDSPELVALFEAAVEALAPGLLASLPTTATPRNNWGGRHYYYRLPHQPAGNTKLAQSELRPQFKEDGTPDIDQRTGKQRMAPETLIETRGEGGYAIVPPSPGACHPSGIEYRHIGGPPLAEVPTITAEHHSILWSVARSFNRYVEERDVKGGAATAKGDNGQHRSGLSPGDDFNARAEWESILEPAGWAKVYSAGERTYWRRPGKSHGFSATTGTRSAAGTDLFCVFTSNGYPFEGAANGRSCSSYSKFAAYALLNHGGDYSAAAKALGEQGYGDPAPVGRLSRYTDDDAPPAAYADEPWPSDYPRHSGNGQPLPIKYARVTAAELDQATYSLEFLIEGTMTAGQPLIVAGGKKTLKTGILCDAAISLAWGPGGDDQAYAVRFLGVLPVARSARVLFMSGESGMATLQETCKRICAAKGIALRDVGSLIFSPDLPRIDDVRHHSALEEMIVGDEIEVLILDPAYLCMGGDDAGNLFKQGATLRVFNSLCQTNGVSLVLCHHTRKNLTDAFKPPELEDIAWAGFQEYARQWWLLGRRERYEPGSGDHKLWLNVGGSAGHSALWALDISEGRLGQPGGRTWGVTLNTPSTAREEALTLQEQARIAARDQKHAAKVKAAREGIAAALRSVDGHADTLSNIKARAGTKGPTFDQALAELLREGRLEETEIVRSNKQPYPGYRYVFEDDR